MKYIAELTIHIEARFNKLYEEESVQHQKIWVSIFSEEEVEPKENGDELYQLDVSNDMSAFNGKLLEQPAVSIDRFDGNNLSSNYYVAIMEKGGEVYLCR